MASLDLNVSLKILTQSYVSPLTSPHLTSHHVSVTLTSRTTDLHPNAGSRACHIWEVHLAGEGSAVEDHEETRQVHAVQGQHVVPRQAREGGVLEPEIRYIKSKQKERGEEERGEDRRWRGEEGEKRGENGRKWT